jgi:uncharacterized membrane-anchored protein YhcB (DUF1043 family)
MSFLLRYWKAIAVIALLGALYVGGLYQGHHSEALKAQAAIAALEAKQAKALADAEQKAREHEAAQSAQFNAIAQQYEQDKAHAEADSKRLAADLRAERVRLRPEWRCVPKAPASAGKPDAAADDRAASAARVVRAAADADDQIRRLQEILKAERATQ